MSCVEAFDAEVCVGELGLHAHAGDDRRLERDWKRDWLAQRSCCGIIARSIMITAAGGLQRRRQEAAPRVAEPLAAAEKKNKKDAEQDSDSSRAHAL